MITRANEPLYYIRDMKFSGQYALWLAEADSRATVSDLRIAGLFTASEAHNIIQANTPWRYVSFPKFEIDSLVEHCVPSNYIDSIAVHEGQDA